MDDKIKTIEQAEAFRKEYRISARRGEGLEDSKFIAVMEETRLRIKAANEDMGPLDD